MTLLEAIRERHSVRRYRPEAISETSLVQLREAVERANSEANLHIQLVTGETKAFSGPMSYGKFTGVSSYLVMAGKRDEDLDERIGYCGEKLVLLAQQIGLNSCWAGLSYRKVSGTYSLEKDEKIACYIALGYGQSQGVPHKSKLISEVSNVSEHTPDWFRKGVEAALLAPTAVNQQKFYIEYLGAESDNLPKVSIRVKGIPLVGYTQMDKGIARLHFEIGAGTENFRWEDDFPITNR